MHSAQPYRPSARVVIKSGNTFGLFCTYTDGSGLPLPLDNATVSAEVRNSNKALITEMSVDVETNSTFRLSLSTPLPVGVYYTDIRIVENGVVRNSDILQLNVIDVVTKQSII